MDELMSIKGGAQERYEEYEELLLKRDRLYKECDSILIEYTRQFGDLIAGNFELKIECIKTKKSIAYCQKQINMGREIDMMDMKGEIEDAMRLYYDEFKVMMAENKRAKEAKGVDEYTISRCKKIYRRLAKKLHPDINERTSQIEELIDLWLKITVAYKTSDVEALEQLELLANGVMKRLGDKGFKVNIDDIEGKIAKVENQINEMITSEPYIYRELLSEPDMIKAKKEELRKEKEEFEKYLDELKETLDKLLMGGKGIIWTMD